MVIALITVSLNVNIATNIYVFLFFNEHPPLILFANLAIGAP